MWRNYYIFIIFKNKGYFTQFWILKTRYVGMLNDSKVSLTMLFITWIMVYNSRLPSRFIAQSVHIIKLYISNKVNIYSSVKINATTYFLQNFTISMKIYYTLFYEENEYAIFLFTNVLKRGNSRLLEMIPMRFHFLSKCAHKSWKGFSSEYINVNS